MDHRSHRQVSKQKSKYCVGCGVDFEAKEDCEICYPVLAPSPDIPGWSPQPANLPGCSSWSLHPTSSEFKFKAPWGIVAGKWWGSRSEQPVLALHGWRDNCGTFDQLIPLLPNGICVLAIDLPGHGKSAPYPTHFCLFLDGIALIRRIVKHYKWNRLVLMGHSLGGALCFMYAACFNKEEDTVKFISIENAGPPVRELKKVARETAECIDQMLMYETLPKMPCDNYVVDNVDVPKADDGSVDLALMEILMKMKARDSNINSCHPSHDLSLGMFSKEQVVNFAHQVHCEVLNIRGKSGMSFIDPSIYPKVITALRKGAKRLVYKEVEGTHNLHLFTPERISSLVRKFLLRRVTPTTPLDECHSSGRR